MDPQLLFSDIRVDAERAKQLPNSKLQIGLTAALSITIPHTTKNRLLETFPAVRFLVFTRVLQRLEQIVVRAFEVKNG
jgi:hypothetical protein